MDTLDEIKQILKEVAISQKETAAQFKETDLKFKETEALIKSNALEISAQFKETSAQFKEISAQFKETDLKFKETEALIKSNALETSAQFKETDKQFKETDARLTKKLEKLHQELGAIGHSNGDAAEAFFYNALEDNLKLGNVNFDFISKNVKQKKHRQEDEYDIFMENGNDVGVIEVKYKVQKQHIEKLIAKKAINFRLLFPDYTNYKLYIGIAGLSFESETEDYATENGLVVLKQRGDVMQVNSSAMRAF